MSVDPLARHIIERLPDLAPQLVIGARFLVDHPDAVITSSMREIAARVGVSPATLVRLARALDFRDWSDLRNSFLSRLRLAPPHYAERAESLVHRQGVEGLIQEVLRAQRQGLDYCGSANSPEAISEAAKVLNRAPRIFLAAFMSCRAPAMVFTYICRLFRSNVQILGGEGTSLAADLEDIRSDDAVLAINFRPYAHDIHTVARAIIRCRPNLVCIADSRITPLTPFANNVLLFGADSPSFFPSIMPAIALLESLAAAMLSHAGEQAVRRVRTVEESLYESGAYDAT
jgi:DNA-binding MurR/RpiR family transcriptional regulator